MNFKAVRKYSLPSKFLSVHFNKTSHTIQLVAHLTEVVLEAPVSYLVRINLSDWPAEMVRKPKLRIESQIHHNAYNDLIVYKHIPVKINKRLIHSFEWYELTWIERLLIRMFY